MSFFSASLLWCFCTLLCRELLSFKQEEMPFPPSFHVVKAFVSVKFFVVVVVGILQLWMPLLHM